MRTRFLRGNTSENNGLTLPAGEVAIDTEKHAVRLHDGQTLGGFELVGTRAYEPYANIIAGDETAGFYGEVPGTDFISYGDLSAQVGLSAGTLQHDAESAWLKFSLDGQTLYVAKKPARYGLSWQAIYQAGCVYGVDGFGSNPSGGNVDQGTIVTIGGVDYRVRLLRGAASDPTTDNTGPDIVESHGSEWNRLLYPVHSGTHTNSDNPATHSDPTAAPFGSWASYSDSDLVVASGTGRRSWTQETTSSNYRVYRGHRGVSNFYRYTATNTNTINGWRPCLERIG